MATKTKTHRPRKRPVPQQLPRKPSRPRWHYAAAAAALVLLAAALALPAITGGDGGAKASEGLPNTPDYHSLLVNPDDPQRLVLGTHGGLYASGDGGRHWRSDALAGSDAMNLSRPTGKTIWLAGHDVFKKSVDAGTTWSDVNPSGLPSLDIHGFTVDPRDPKVLYAAVAGEGLYRSSDGGSTFSLVSSDVGGSVMALAVMPDGRILAGDMQQGLLESRDDGTSWAQTLGAQLMGLAVNPSDPKRILATGAGIALSTDGGRTWRTVLDRPNGSGPVAWSASNPQLAYVVGFDRTLWRSNDAGATWTEVAPAGEG
jgi:photosystem II stability/assembly factor-like uncharacterized protein